MVGKCFLCESQCNNYGYMTNPWSYLIVSRGGLKWATPGRVKTGHYFN